MGADDCNQATESTHERLKESIRFKNDFIEKQCPKHESAHKGKVRSALLIELGFFKKYWWPKLKIIFYFCLKRPEMQKKWVL